MLQKNFQVDVQVTGPNYALISIVDNDLRLKIDFVNDVSYGVEQPISATLFKRTDHWKNILSNKLSALQRDAAKEIADIILLSENFNFNWPAVLEEASKKDMWINELEISSLLDRYQIDQIQSVCWINTPDLNALASSLKAIAKDILLGSDNSLFKG